MLLDKVIDEATQRRIELLNLPPNNANVEEFS